MSFCPKCGSDLPENSKFCIQCGNQIDLAIQKDNLENNKVDLSRFNEHTTDTGKMSFNEVANSVNDNTKLYIILGWISCVLSIIVVPILFSAGGIICGYLLSQKNKQHGVIMIIMAVACGLLGAILGFAMGMSSY